jgi:hypothetical protein
MRNIFVIGIVLAVGATSAMAQTQLPAQNGPQNSAVNSSNSSNRQVNAPVKGSNSFTQGEAKSRLEKLGFSDVTNLQKDADGVWRGRAMKDGKTIDVSLDYQGNVVQGNAGTSGPGAPVRGNAGR